MIYDVSGKRIVFGMVWETRLSDVDVHKKARAAKSPYLWTQDKAINYGLLNDADREEKLRKPLYSGAVVLQHRYPDVQNLMLVLAVPDGTFIACGLHQGRPRTAFDTIVPNKEALTSLLASFRTLCGGSSFKLYGDAGIPAIEHTTMADIIASADANAQLRRVKSALVNPLAATAGSVAVLAALGYGYHAFSQYRAAEAQRAALASQKSSQTLYAEELTARRNDAALPARSIFEAFSLVRAMTMSMGGWTLTKSTCNVSIEKQLVCTYAYKRGENRLATNRTFVAAAGKFFDNIEFSGDGITGTKQYKLGSLGTKAAAIDAAKSQREEAIEFGSELQRLSVFGKTQLKEAQPFAVPPTAVVAELSAPPVGAAEFTFDGPGRSLKGFASFPAYATVTKLEVIFDGKPAYELNKSMAMATVTGTIFSKPN
jgi:hypothetical protein